MGQLNQYNLESELDRHLQAEKLTPVPFDFSQRVMTQIKMQPVVRGGLFSWLDLILSLGAATTLGMAFLLPFLLPVESRPRLVWMAQYSAYLIEKLVYNLPYAWLAIAAGLMVLGILFLLRKEVKAIKASSGERTISAPGA